MGRLVFILLLITNLLVCPLRCFSCNWETGVGAASVAGCVCCCPSPERNDDPKPGERAPENPQPSEEDCSCLNCICEGATRQDSQELSEDHSPLGAAGLLLPGALRSSDEASPISRGVAACPPVIPGGRRAQIAHQSWLL